MKARRLLTFLFLLLPTWLAAESRLIFPDVNQGNQTTVGIAVFNPLSNAAEVTFTARRLDGTLLQGEGIENPSVRQVAARSQIALLADQIFNLPAGEGTPVWIELTSEADGIKGFFLSLEDGLARVDGAGAFEDSSQAGILFLPPGIDPDASFLHVVNPSQATSNLEIRSVMVTGAVKQQIGLQIPAQGKIRRSLASLLEEYDPAENLYLRIVSDVEVVSYLLFRTGNSVATSSGLPGLEAARLFSPQLATGPIIASLLQLSNTGNEAQTLRITARAGDGELLEAATQNPREVTLDPGQLLQEDAGEFFGLPAEETHDGWIEIVSTEEEQDVTAAGAIVFGAPDGSFTAALPFQSEGNRVSLFSHVAQGQFGPIAWFTGLAMLNPGDLAAEVSVSVRDTEGMITGEGEATLAPRQRISDVLPEIIEDFEPQAGGSITITSNQPILTFSLFGLGDLSALAAIPTQVVNQTMKLDGNSVLEGRIEAPIIVLSSTEDLVPSGDLELVADLGIFIETPIKSAFDVTLTSPEGTVSIGGNGPAQTGNLPAGNDRAPREPFLQGRNLYGVNSNLFLFGDAEALPGDPTDRNGGSIHIKSKTINSDCRSDEPEGGLTPCTLQAGDGYPGSGSTSEETVMHSGNGGDVLIFRPVLLGSRREEVRVNGRSPLTVVAGNGGSADGEIVGYPEAYGADGGDAGEIVLILGRGRLHEIDIELGSGGSGQGATVDGNDQQDSAARLRSVGGKGGHASDLSLQVSGNRPFELSIDLYESQSGAGGKAIVQNGNGKDGSPPTPGPDIEALGGDPGRDGIEMIDTPDRGVIIERVPVVPTQAAPAVLAGAVEIVNSGNGGDSTSPASDGGAAGAITAKSGTQLSDKSDKVTIAGSANGGKAANACNPAGQGSDGGNGGNVTAVGFSIDITLTGNGTNGGAGMPPGKGGTGGVPDLLGAIQTVDGFSFKNGTDGPDCGSVMTADATVVRIGQLAGDDQFTVNLPPAGVLRLGASLGGEPFPDTSPFELRNPEESCQVAPLDGFTRFLNEGFVEALIQEGIFRLCLGVPSGSGSSSGALLGFYDAGTIEVRAGQVTESHIDITSNQFVPLETFFEVTINQDQGLRVDLQGLVFRSMLRGELFVSTAEMMKSQSLQGGAPIEISAALPPGTWTATAVIAEEDPFKLVRVRLGDPIVVTAASGVVGQGPEPIQLSTPTLHRAMAEGAAELGLFFINFQGEAAGGLGLTDDDGTAQFIAPNGTYSTNTIVSLDGQGFLFRPHGNFTVNGPTSIMGLTEPPNPDLFDIEIVLLDALGSPVTDYVVEIFSDDLTDLTGGEWVGFCQASESSYHCPGPASGGYRVKAYSPNAQVFQLPGSGGSPSVQGAQPLKKGVTGR